ncbi:MAG TPA: hypothetical protein VE990_01290 [Acidimicrobiales bacterium]|nr:hypothetical protein [Acidimicrobiales bacterium]
MDATALRHRVVARNAATQSENRIHDDEIARRHGFSGGLVPGVTLYAYITQPVVARFGRPWLENGTIAVRFVRPVYEGDEVLVTASPSGDRSLDLALTDSAGTTCVTGSALLPAAPASPPDPSGYEVVALPKPAERPPADQASLAPGTALGTLHSPTGAERSRHSAAYTALFDGDLALYDQDGLVHPGELILAANAVLAGSVAMGPWIHVGSEVTNFAAVPVGAVTETRAKVLDRFERGERRFVVLDVIWLVDGRPTTRARHTAIYQL